MKIFWLGAVRSILQELAGVLLVLLLESKFLKAVDLLLLVLAASCSLLFTLAVNEVVN